jgi:uncharacterized FlaG/YvyC family protein
MNIKGLIGSIPTTPVKQIDRTERLIKSDMAHDRDPNGQQAFDQKEKDQGPMNDEEMKKSLEHLKNLPFVKDHKWSIELVSESTENSEKRFVLVKDALGTIIRKIPEKDLWTLPLDFNEQKGQLLRKTA